MKRPCLAVSRPLNQREAALAQADARLLAAREAFGKAALACLARRADAEQLVGVALREVDAARAAVRELADDETERVVNAAPARAAK